MAHSNDMSALLNKIERRLGLTTLVKHLPEDLNKEAWAEIIKTDTLVTFSRYFPLKFPYLVNSETTTFKNGRYYLNEDILQDTKVLGIIDLDWSDFGSDNLSLSQIGSYGYYQPTYYGSSTLMIDQIMGQQMNANINSLFNNGIYINYIDPNQFELRGIGNLELNFHQFKVNLLVEHKNLSTISPTKMEKFEELAQADIANYLYKNLRYFDNLETIYVNIDLKLNELETEASKRDNIIEAFTNSYVTASNDNIPYIMTV